MEVNEMDKFPQAPDEIPVVAEQNVEEGTKKDGE